MGEKGYMADDPPNRIAEIRKQKKLTQQQLADLVGSHWITISKLERGVMRLTFEWMSKLADALGVAPGSLLGREGNFLAEHEVRVDGRVVSGRLLPANLPEIRRVKEVVDRWDARFQPFWAELSDDSLLPFFVAGDLLQFTWIANEAAFSAIGRVVVARLTDESLLMGVLTRVAYAGPDYMRTGTEVPATGDIRLFSGMEQREVEIRDLAVFIGCSVFWHSKSGLKPT